VGTGVVPAAPERGRPVNLGLDVAVVSYGTHHLLLNLLRSLARTLVPAGLGQVHVWDNASPDRSREVLVRVQGEAPWLRIHLSPRNVHHGPALDALLREHARAEWVLLLDSDTEVRRDFRGALPPLGPVPPAFVGQLQPDLGPLHAYLAHLLVHRPTYLRLPPFRRGGAPAADYFRAVARRGLPFVRFRFRSFVDHLGQGTLRALSARGERGHELFAFAEAESRRCPAPPSRLRREEALQAEVRELLDGGPFLPQAASETPPAPDERPFAPCFHVFGPGPAAPAEPWSSRLVPGFLRATLGLRRAGRVGLALDAREVVPLLTRLAASPPRCVLEVGTGYGGALVLWARAAAADALLVSVDQPPWEPDDPGEADRVRRFASFRRPGQVLHLARGEAHHPDVRARVARWLEAGSVDFLYLDGHRTREHGAPGIGADLATFAPLVRPGGLVAISGVRPGPGEAARFWRDLAAARPTLGVLGPPRGAYGIGLLRA
jgi:MMP 1-O-methyltransferase